MVQQQEVGDQQDIPSRLNVVPLAGVDISDAAARLQSRGDVSNDNIFDILPRFNISPVTVEGEESYWTSHADKGEKIIRVNAAVGGADVTGIAVGCELVVFERDKDEPAKTLKFSAPIDFIVWRRSILLIGLSSSELILVDPSYYDIKHKWKLDPDAGDTKRFFVDAFIHSNPDPTKIDVLVVTVCGLICRYPDVSLSVGSLDATHDQNVSLDIDIGTAKEISTKLKTTSEIVCVSSPSRNQVTVVESSGRVMIIDLSDSSFDEGIGRSLFGSSCLSLNNPSGVVPKKVLSFEGMLFILLSNGTLKVTSGGNLFEFPNPLKKLSDESIIHDFTLVMNNEGVVKLWTLYCSNSSVRNENYIEIFSGPNFITEFCFKLPMPQMEKDFKLKFPRHVSTFEEPFSIIEITNQNVRLYHMLETSTDVTLQKLLSRGKYSDAKELAMNFNKNLDIVKKAEARDRLNRIESLANVEAETDSCVKELIDVLRSIKDAEFVCNFCVHAKLPKVEWLKLIVGLGKERVQECQQTNAAKALLLTVKKFYTFELVYPSGGINDWESLISTDNNMFLQSMKFLQKGSFRKCDTVWKRHSEEFITLINLSDFLPFFNVIFDHQLKSSESISLLTTILPFAVEKVAQSVSVTQHIGELDGGVLQLNALIAIILRQINTLEGRVEWPMNALNFVQVLKSIIVLEIKRYETSRAAMDASITKKKFIVHTLNKHLQGFEQVLVELTDLKKHHSIIIFFKDYTELNIPDVINKMLHKLLRHDEIERFVSHFLRPYAERKKFSIDGLFSAHIEFVLQDIPYFIQAINIPHEERIICLVNLIFNPKVKLQCALKIAEEWPVPWTVGVDNMIQQILETYPRQSLDLECAGLRDNISLMRKQVPFRCVLNKYKLSSSKILQNRCHVTMALLRILNSKKAGCYEDCKELLRHIPSRVSLDDVRLEYLEFTLRMYDADICEEDVFQSQQLKPKLQKAVFDRVVLELQHFENSDELQHLYTPEEQSRLINMYSFLASELNDSRSSMTANLKRMCSSIPLDIVHHPEFPFTILSYLLEESSSKTPSELILDCKKLSKITEAYHLDFLIVIANYFAQPNLPGNPGAIVWSIVEHIVKSPLDINVNNSRLSQELLQNASYGVASLLMLQCPSLSIEKMCVLHEFLCRLVNSFDSLGEEIGRMLCFFRIFMNLKEQEIPLECEFLEIFKWLLGTSGTWENNIKIVLQKIGETLLKFGEIDIYMTVFKSIKRNILGVCARMKEETHLKYYTQVVIDINNMKDDLLKRPLLSEEKDIDCARKKLVEDLNAAGIKVNSYALEIRNKVKLLERLIGMRNYGLASQLAITFGFYEDSKSWSSILQGFISSGNIDELRMVLESVCTVTELWMLPEFSVAWKKVSELDSSFFFMCPIPLE